MVPDILYWGLQLQLVDLARLDQYLASVADQEQALHEESDAFAGRLVLRSQPMPERFWLVDAWTDRYSLESAAIMLRTLSSVAGLTEPAREILTEQVPVGSAGLVLPGGAQRQAADPLPFFLVNESRVKPVVVGDYLAMQEQFTGELELEQGFGRRLLLRDIKDNAHFFCIDEWRTERDAYEAFEHRQGAVSEIVMTRYLALLSERGERDFALGLHG